MSPDGLDIIICIVPKIDPDAPTVGPAILKSHLMAAGLSCEVVDLNIKLYNALKEHDTHDQHYFENDKLFGTAYTSAELNDDFKKFCVEYDYILMEWMDFFKRKDPRWIGLSVLSFYSVSMAIKLSQMIREHMPDVKIVWGGPQIDKGVENFKAIGLLDHYICGDAEFSLIELIRGNTSAKGIDTPIANQVDLNLVMTPNYDDINWDEYGDSNIIYLTGSRGCVKRCTFCNVYQIWPEYRFRSGKNIVEEMKILRNKYGKTEFRFTDSLINGSMKSFREMMHELIEYRKIDDLVTWSSQWIIRPMHQSPEEDFRLMKESGCVDLEVGIESFSQEVRYHMGKKFTDEDMWWCFEMLQKYNIRHALLLIAGYPTETEEDHQITLDTVNKLFDVGYATTKDSTGRNLIHFSLSNTMVLLNDSPILKQIKDELTYFEDELVWDYRGNDLFTRLRRFNETHALIQKRNNGRSGWWMYKKALRMYTEILEKRDQLK